MWFERRKLILASAPALLPNDTPEHTYLKSKSRERVRASSVVASGSAAGVGIGLDEKKGQRLRKNDTGRSQAAEPQSLRNPPHAGTVPPEGFCVSSVASRSKT